MPRWVSWEGLAVNVGGAEAEAVVARLKSFDIDKSQAMECTICLGTDRKMRYRLLECGSESCAGASAVKRAWRGKMLTCLETEHVRIFDYGEHNSATASPGRTKLILAHKAFVQDLTQNHLRPMRIHRALSRKFATSLEDLQPLKTVQNFDHHYGRTQLENHDRVQDLTTWISDRAYGEHGTAIYIHVAVGQRRLANSWERLGRKTVPLGDLLMLRLMVPQKASSCTSMGPTKRTKETTQCW
jgi:hypothetical protein